MVVACLLLAGALLGYSWTGSQIRMYDDSDATGGHTAGQPHSAAEMAASTDANVAANWTAYTGNAAKYRGLATVLLGSSTGGTATTTWTDQDAVFDWDNTKTLSLVGSNNFLNWGVKVGTGVIATGRNGVHAYFGASATLPGSTGLAKIYGGSLTAKGINSFLALAGNASSEYIDIIPGVTGTGSAANVRIGTGSTQAGTLYNVDFWGNGSGATSSIISVFNPTLCQRVTCGGNAMNSQLRLTSQPIIAIREPIFFGTPATADIIAISTTPTSWDIVRPTWSGAARFTFQGSFSPGVVREQWVFDVKVVDGAGDPVSGVAVTLTDVTGTVQVNTTTNSEGRITYGSGITANCVTVLDYYATSGVLQTRTRSPFLLDVGGGKRRIRFDWPGESTQTYSDVIMPVPWEWANGTGATIWNEFEQGVWPPA